MSGLFISFEGGGGPGSSTTFLSQLLTTMAVGQFDLGPAAAFSLIYFLVILLFSYVFYTAMALGIVCLIASICLHDFDHYLTDHVSRQIYHREQTKVDILQAKGIQTSSDVDAATTATTGSQEKESTSNHEKAEISV